MTNCKIPVCSVVACLMPEYGIGYNGQLPWKLSREMRYFKQLTTSTFDPTLRNAVVMGRKTWESIPQRFRPLPGRLNVVVSRQYPDEWSSATESTASHPVESSEHVIRSNSLDRAIQLLQQQSTTLNLERIYIIGGADIYQQSTRFADYMYITKINHLVSPPSMDTFLDKELIESTYQELPATKLSSCIPSSVDLPPDSAPIIENNYSYSFTLWSRATRDQTP